MTPMNNEDFLEIEQYLQEVKSKGWVIYFMSGRIYAVHSNVEGKSFDNIEKFKRFIEENVQ